MKVTAVRISSFTYLFSFGAILIAVFFSIIGFTEFFKVIVLKKTGAYPFGCVNGCIWYYKNAGVYGMYNLFSGLLFSTLLVLMVVGVRRI
jgi:hypothetical protein